MNKNEFEEYKESPLSIIYQTISIEELYENEISKETTLFYGKYEQDYIHVYTYDDYIHVLIYDENETPKYYEFHDNIPIPYLFLEKIKIYPENTLLSFANILKEYGEKVNFFPFSKTDKEQITQKKQKIISKKY